MDTYVLLRQNLHVVKFGIKTQFKGLIKEEIIYSQVISRAGTLF